MQTGTLRGFEQVIKVAQEHGDPAAIAAAGAELAQASSACEQAWDLREPSR